MSHGGHKISLLFWKNTRLVKFWRFQTGLCHKQTSKQITLLSPNNNQITKTDQVYFFFHDGQEKHASSAWLSPSVCIVRCVTSHFPRQLQHKVFRVLFFVFVFFFYVLWHKAVLVYTGIHTQMSTREMLSLSSLLSSASKGRFQVFQHLRAFMCRVRRRHRKA